LVCTLFSSPSKYLAIGLPVQHALIVGIAAIFSSTILVVKLLPTTTLHQRKMGAQCIALLIVQDLLAVAALILVSGLTPESMTFLPLWGALFIGGVLVTEKYVLRMILSKVEHYHELLYLLALSWFFAVAMIAREIGLSVEIGAFIAGMALARNPIAPFLAEGLKFFRDFFLILFFFVLGAGIDPRHLGDIWLSVLLFAIVLVVVKPAVYALLFRVQGESWKFSREVGVRLGQSSEFSLILVIAARQNGIINEQTAVFITLSAIVTFFVSSYVTVFFFQSPLGTAKRLKKD